MKRVLFVDDDPLVLAGLRRLLRPHRAVWDMVFVESGERALKEVEAGSFDVVVCDMRMPGMDGVAVLTEVQRSDPGTVRIILSGESGIRKPLELAPVAHQYLAKPCSADTMLAVLDRACQLRGLLRDNRLREITGGVDRLPSAPRVYLALTAVLARDDARMEDVSAVIEGDPAMCAKLLQLANSAFFGLARRVTSAREAARALGTSLLRSLVLAAEAFEGFRGAGPDGSSVQLMQEHALLVAGLSRRMVGDPRTVDEAVMVAMLHDIGRLVLASRAAVEFAEMMQEARREQASLHEVEVRRLGVSHAEIGAYLLDLWGLPYSIVEAVANHHHPCRSSVQAMDLTAIVHVADVLAHRASQGGARRTGENECGIPAEPMNPELDADVVRRPQLEGWYAVALTLAGGAS